MASLPALAAPLAALAVIAAIGLTIPAPPSPPLAARVEAAIALQKMELWDRSGRAFADVLAEDPDNVRANFAIGVVASQTKRHAEAEARLKKALAGDPGNLEIKFALAVAYQKAKRFKEAEAVYQELRRTSPEDYRPVNNLAEIAIHRQQYELARSLLREYLASLPATSSQRRRVEKRIKRLTDRIGDAPSPAPSKK